MAVWPQSTIGLIKLYLSLKVHNNSSITHCHN